MRNMYIHVLTGYSSVTLGTYLSVLFVLRSYEQRFILCVFKNIVFVFYEMW